MNIILNDRHCRILWKKTKEKKNVSVVLNQWASMKSTKNVLALLITSTTNKKSPNWCNSRWPLIYPCSHIGHQTLVSSFAPRLQSVEVRDKISHMQLMQLFCSWAQIASASSSVHLANLKILAISAPTKGPSSAFLGTYTRTFLSSIGWAFSPWS